jgi:hypothetical protein
LLSNGSICAPLRPADPKASPKPRSELVRPLVINRPFLYVMVHAPTVGGLYKLNGVDPQLESAWFQPLNP